MCYRFEVSMSGPAIELHNCMAKLLAHPLQRPFQSHASYSLLEGEDPQDIEATVWRGLFHKLLHSNNFSKLFTLSCCKFSSINESLNILRKGMMELFGCKSAGERLGFVKGSLDPFSSFSFLHGVHGEIKSKLSNLSVLKICFPFSKGCFQSFVIPVCYTDSGRMHMNVDVNLLWHLFSL